MKASDNDVDVYIRESCRSFKECSIKNTARRNSLQKKTLGIESERRMASAQMSKEERMLRQQLRQMNIEKAKNNIIHNLRETKAQEQRKKKTKKDESHVIPTEPYPVTFRSNTPSPTELERQMDSAGRSYSAHRRRRESREFEDLKLHSATGKLHHVDERLEADDGPRRRVSSMSHAQRPRMRHLHPDYHSNASTPRVSPDLRRRVLSPRLSRKKDSSGSSSKEDVDSIGSLDDMHWVGEPEAIHSVRRPRKTHDEQEMDAELHRLGVR